MKSQAHEHIPNLTPGGESPARGGLPVDPLATTETRNLCWNLFLLTTGGLQSFRKNLHTIVLHARSRNKLAALTEVGQKGPPTPDWFTRVLLGSLKEDPVNAHVVYAAVWRNASTTHHFAPYPGHESVPDFLHIYQDPYTLFLRDVPPLYASRAAPPA